MTRITSPCPCPNNCGGTYEREQDDQTSANVDTYPPEPHHGPIRRALDLTGILTLAAVIRAYDWAIQRANHPHSHTPISVLKETR